MYGMYLRTSLIYRYKLLLILRVFIERRIAKSRRRLFVKRILALKHFDSF